MSEILTNHLNTSSIALGKLNKLEATEISPKELNNVSGEKTEKIEKTEEIEKNS